MLFTPLKQRKGLEILNYSPLACKSPCRAVINPYWYLRCVVWLSILTRVIVQPNRYQCWVVDMLNVLSEEPAAFPLS